MDKFEKLGASLKDVDWKEQELTSFRKNFYIEHQNVTQRSDSQVEAFRKANQIDVKGEAIPRPVESFQESSLPKYLTEQLQNLFEKPTTIQSQCWPIALLGRDLVGIAETGSGKTLAFILPAIVHVMDQEMLRRGDGPIALIMAPTRELALQIEQECQKFAKVCQLSCTTVYGGVPKSSQQLALQKGVEILIATPGRLIDFMESSVAKMNRVTYLVLDEADRMLDMGFEKYIRKILSQIRPDRQTLMFSATWPKEVEALAKQYCTLPVQVKVGNHEITANFNIQQKIEVIDEQEKYEQFIKLLQKLNDGSKILVFCETKRTVDDLVKSMRCDRWHSMKGIHGDKTQQERDQVFKEFKDGTNHILIATDVASRGLDVKDIAYVINFDMPFQIEDYVHRIGRTGRAGSTGTAYSFVTRKNLMLTPEIVKLLNRVGQDVPQKLKDLAKIAEKTQGEQVYRKWRQIPGSNKQKEAPQVSAETLKSPEEIINKRVDLQQEEMKENYTNGKEVCKPEYAIQQEESQDSNEKIQQTKINLDEGEKKDLEKVQNELSEKFKPNFNNFFENDNKEQKEQPKDNKNPVYKKKWGQK